MGLKSTRNEPLHPRRLIFAKRSKSQVSRDELTKVKPGGWPAKTQLLTCALRGPHDENGCIRVDSVRHLKGGVMSTNHAGLHATPTGRSHGNMDASDARFATRKQQRMSSSSVVVIAHTCTNHGWLQQSRVFELVACFSPAEMWSRRSQHDCTFQHKSNVACCRFTVNFRADFGSFQP